MPMMPDPPKKLPGSHLLFTVSIRYGGLDAVLLARSQSLRALAQRLKALLPPPAVNSPTL